MNDYVNNLYDGNGYYSYNYTYDFIADYLHATTGLGGAGYTQLHYGFDQAFGNPAAEISTSEYAGYATDDVNDEAYTLSGTTLTLYPDFGQYTNSNSWTHNYTPRQVQIAARFHF